MAKFLTIFTDASIRNRALIVASVIGPVLTLINQYDAIVNQGFEGVNFLKVGLTFVVPYLVSSYSSLRAKSNPKQILEGLDDQSKFVFLTRLQFYVFVRRGLSLVKTL